jgi:hypothetical protein
MEGFIMFSGEQRQMQADCVEATADYFMNMLRSNKTDEQKRKELVRNLHALLQAQLDELQGK